MDKGRHPQAVRTWKVERTKVPYGSAEPAKARSGSRQDLIRGPKKQQPDVATAPTRGR